MNGACFIYRANIFSTTGKTKKGKLLIEYLNSLKKVMIDGTDSMQAVTDVLVDLVDWLNERFPDSKKWHVTPSDFMIEIKSVADGTGPGRTLAVIVISEVRMTMPAESLASMLEYLKLKTSVAAGKGGQR